MMNCAGYGVKRAISGRMAMLIAERQR